MLDLDSLQWILVDSTTCKKDDETKSICRSYSQVKFIDYTSAGDNDALHWFQLVPFKNIVRHWSATTRLTSWKDYWPINWMLDFCKSQGSSFSSEMVIRKKGAIETRGVFRLAMCAHDMQLYMWYSQLCEVPPLQCLWSMTCRIEGLMRRRSVTCVGYDVHLCPIKRIIADLRPN